MSRSIIIVSAIFGITAFVSAAPHHPLIGVHTGNIGIGDVNAQNMATDVVNANGLNLHSILYDISKLLLFLSFILLLT